MNLTIYISKENKQNLTLVNNKSGLINWLLKDYFVKELAKLEAETETKYVPMEQ